MQYQMVTVYTYWVTLIHIPTGHIYSVPMTVGDDKLVTLYNRIRERWDASFAIKDIEPPTEHEQPIFYL